MMKITREFRGKHGGIGTLIIASILLLSGCGNNKETTLAKPVEVSVIKVVSEAMPLYSELPGRINSLRVAEVRARVTGVLKKQYFTDGALVKEGDVLFLIDPDPMQAAYDSAKASLEKAQATLTQDELTAGRYTLLVKSGAVSQQDYDSAQATLAEQKAEVASARATLKTAELNLGYTKVTAPISGRIGKALVTEGALVNSGALTELALIQQTDTVFFDFTQSNADVLKMRRAFSSGKLTRNSGKADNSVSLLLEDGSTYEHTGELLFSDITVDETTGMVSMRARFPNPEGLLLPGSFARIRISQAVNKNSLTVPQRAVIRNADGTATVYVVGAGNKVEQRQISASSMAGNRWIVTSGLADGETIIVEGLQKIKPGQVVTTVAYDLVAGASTPDNGKVE